MQNIAKRFVDYVSNSLVGNALRGIREEVQGLILPFVVVSIPILALVGSNWFETQRSRTITMTAGAETGRRHALARDYLPVPLAANNVTLHLQPSSGSGEALQLVNDGKVDMALVQGGLDKEPFPNVRQVAALYQEPLHLLLKKDLYPVAAKSSLKQALLGKHIYLSTRGSGTHILSQRVIALTGMTAQDYFEEQMKEEDLLAASATVDKLPDAVFLVSLLPSLTAQRLITDFGYKLYPLRFAETYQLDDNRVAATTFPLAVYSADPPEPEAPLPTIATRLLLVANAKVPTDAVQRVLAAVLTSEFSKVYRPPLALTNLDLATEFPVHPGTEIYQNNKLPINRETVQGLQTLWGSIAGLLPAVFLLSRWLRSGRGRQRQILSGEQLRSISKRVTETDTTVFALERSANLNLEELLELRGRMSELRRETMGVRDAGSSSLAATISTLLGYISDLDSRVTSLLAVVRSLPQPPAGEATTTPEAPAQQPDEVLVAG